MKPRTCRFCGCTDLQACRGGCSWVGADVCSRCAAKAQPKERPILFSAPMVRALLAGRKTQTRRVMKKPPTGVHGLRLALATCPYGRPGDRLWVRETFKAVASGEVKDGYGEVRYGWAYAADATTSWAKHPTIIHDMTGQPETGPMQFRAVPWKPSIHMPRKACRLVLEITDVRVQRLQEITEDDAIAEGVDGPMCAELAIKTPWRDVAAPVAVHTYAALWDSINGAGAWNSNPWVWALTFKVVG